METIQISSEGQITLPAPLRRKLGIEAGAELCVLEEPDGLRLRIVRPPLNEAQRNSVARLAGMVTAPALGSPRRLEDFDPAALLARGRSDNG